MMKRPLIAVASLALLAACNSGTSAAGKDARISNSQLGRYQANQPIPASDWSQYRATAIDVEQAQIHGMATTSFFFVLGSREPIKVCPSIGFPLPSTAQLTSPEAPTYSGSTGVATVPQQEPNGIYTGTSTGTYVVCVTSSGRRAVDYWEGDVESEGGTAHWDASTGIVLDGNPTVTATTK